MSKIQALTLFYDSFCPLCMTEMRHLKKRDKAGNLTFVDINDEHFGEAYPQFNYDDLNARIHGLTPEGNVITGLDVTYHAWRLVGHGWLYAPLRWPIIRIVADWVYVKFAKHRYTVSFWLTGKRRCERCRESL
jgi:predicted DCC family thiol-disulfide oxidoreductase YuxK